MKTMNNPFMMTFLLFLISVQSCFAGQTLKVAFGDALPPWVIPGNDSGITIDILRESLESEGYSIQPVYVPYARRLIAYKGGDVDAVIDINQNIIKNSNLEGYLSEVAYAYENVGISLKQRGYKFSKISDLLDYSVLAWQGAKEAIGGEYAHMANSNKKYREIANQETQIKMLYMGREDVVQLDMQIFKYYRNKVNTESNIDTKQPVDIHPLFGKNECGFLFRDKNVRDAFDKNFSKIKVNGQYEKIFDRYTKE